MKKLKEEQKEQGLVEKNKPKLHSMRVKKRKKL